MEDWVLADVFLVLGVLGFELGLWVVGVWNEDLALLHWDLRVRGSLVFLALLLRLFLIFPLLYFLRMPLNFLNNINTILNPTKITRNNNISKLMIMLKQIRHSPSLRIDNQNRKFFELPHGNKIEIFQDGILGPADGAHEIEVELD